MIIVNSKHLIKKYIIHLEYCEDYAEKELKDRRVFKTNIVSHNYEALYKTEALVFRGINITANHVMQPGFIIEGGTKENRKKIQAWAEYTGLEIIFHDLIRSLLMFGNSYYEIIDNDSDAKKNDSEFKVEHLKAVPPGTMFVYRKETGDVIGYVQIPKTRRFFKQYRSYLKVKMALSNTLSSYQMKDELDKNFESLLDETGEYMVGEESETLYKQWMDDDEIEGAQFGGGMSVNHNFFHFYT